MHFSLQVSTGMRPGRASHAPDHCKRADAKDDPRGQVALEDGVHPEIGVPHIVLKVEQFDDE